MYITDIQFEISSFRKVLNHLFYHPDASQNPIFHLNKLNIHFKSNKIHTHKFISFFNFDVIENLVECLKMIFLSLSTIPVTQMKQSIHEWANENLGKQTNHFKFFKGCILTLYRLFVKKKKKKKQSCKENTCFQRH